LKVLELTQKYLQRTVLSGILITVTDFKACLYPRGKIQVSNIRGDILTGVQ